MKKNYLVLAFAIFSLLGINLANGTTHTITAAGTTIPTDIFTPDTTFAVVGDTIIWVWLDGLHTTESVTIPAGAASFNSLLDSATQSFTYVVTQPGTYYYDCHASFGGHGMDGRIIVTGVASIGSTTGMGNTLAYPNPFIDEVVFDIDDADAVRVYNIVGQEVLSASSRGNATILKVDTRTLKSGMYFFSLIKNGQVVETKKLLKN